MNRIGVIAFGVAALGVALLISACGGRMVKQGNEEFTIKEDKYLEALTLQDDYQYFKAIEAWKEVLEDEPRFAMGHFNLGVIYDEMNLVPEAVQEYELAVRHDPQPEYHANLGAAYLRSGQPQDALTQLKKALAKDQYNARIHYNIAGAYMALGNTDQGLLHADRAVDLAASPDSKSTSGLAESVDRVQLGQFLVRQSRCHLQRGELDKAKAAMERAETQCEYKVPNELKRDVTRAVAKAEEEAAEESTEESNQG